MSLTTNRVSRSSGGITVANFSHFRMRGENQIDLRGHGEFRRAGEGANCDFGQVGRESGGEAQPPRTVGEQI